MPSRVTRRRFVRDGGKAVATLALLRPLSVFAQHSFDLVLKGGTILDGTGAPAWSADIGIVGDRIDYVGSIVAGQARQMIDVSGLHVSPGFIDMHSHSDRSILRYPTADSRIRQGITTEVTGNCGSSAAPLTGDGLEEARAAGRDEGIETDWTDVASYCRRLEQTGISVNHALLLGQGSMRRNAIGMVNRPMTPDELAAMLRAVEEGMDQGAFGVSTGLEYTPGRYTPTGEVVAIARVVARRNGLYASHIRNEETRVLAAVNEAIDIGRQAGARVQISHLKAAGRPNWPKQRGSIALIEAARRDGIEVLADAYPYTAYSTGLTVLMADWALEGGTPAIMQRLGDAPDRARIRREVAAQVEIDPGDYSLIVISSVRSERNRPVVGRSLQEIAGEWNVEPIDALLRLLEEEEASVSYVGHGMSPDNVEMVLSHPLVMIGSDGSTMAPVGPAAETRPHPRSYGAYPRVLGYYVRERRLFDLPTAIRKMTSMPADQAGIRDRGRIARGQKADLVVFDAGAVMDAATFEDPHRYPAGIPHVIVNGVPVVRDGEHTGARPGQVLRKT